MIVYSHMTALWFFELNAKMSFYKWGMMME